MSYLERLQAALIKHNISEAELSRKLGINQSSITRWKTREVIPSADLVVNAAKILHTTAEYLVNGDTSAPKSITTLNSFFVPILNQELSAGNGSMLEDEDVVKGLIAVPPHLREYGKNLAGLYVHGDSMEPTLYNGDLVICTSLGWDNEEGLYAVRFNGKAYVKRIQVGAGKIIIKSDNPKYETISEPAESENFIIIGKVVLIIKTV